MEQRTAVLLGTVVRGGPRTRLGTPRVHQGQGLCSRLTPEANHVLLPSSLLMGMAVSSTRQLRSVGQEPVVFLPSPKSVLADSSVSREGPLPHRLSVGGVCAHVSA